MYYMFIYLQAQSANFTYLIFDIPKIKLYAAHTCINVAQILIPMFQFLCLKIVKTNSVLLVVL